MKSLYLRIYLTVVAVLLLFAFGSGWLAQRQIDSERARSESMLSERMEAWADLLQRSLPGADAPAPVQAAALADWSQRLRLPLALDDAQGRRIATSESFTRRYELAGQRGYALSLSDGRTLWVMRPGGMRGMRAGRPASDGADGTGPGAVVGPGVGPGTRAGIGPGPGPGMGPAAGAGMAPGPGRALESGRGVGPERPALVRPGLREPLAIPFLPPAWQSGTGLAVVLMLLFVAVALGAYPVVRRLTRRLEALKQGVDRFGEGDLRHRVDVVGKDEVAAVAASFNQAAAKVESLVRANQSLLANASHELRSPLARMKMAVAMLDEAAPAQRERLRREIHTNVAELDALVEEVLLASRLDAAHGDDSVARDRVDLLALAAEEAARVGATVDGPPSSVRGDERLLRRAVRNLLENAGRYGGGEVAVTLGADPARARLSVCDRGPGVPEPLRERIFEPFYRLPGHAEKAGGVGLGLSLVRQIAQTHGGSVHCEARDGGGSCFVLSLPV